MAGQELKREMAQVDWETGPSDSAPSAPAAVVLDLWHRLTTKQTWGLLSPGSEWGQP